MRRGQRLALLVALPAIALVGSGVAWASSITLTSKQLGSATLVPPVMFPDALATGNAGTAGKAEKNDTVTFTFSRPINETTLCSGWTGQPATKSIPVSWVIQNNTGTTGNDVLAVQSVGTTCATGFHIGTVDLGSANYVINNNVAVTNCPTALALGATTTTITVTFTAPQTGGSNGTVQTVAAAAASPAVWTPDPVVADTSGNTISASGTNVAKTSSSVQL